MASTSEHDSAPAAASAAKEMKVEEGNVEDAPKSLTEAEEPTAPEAKKEEGEGTTPADALASDVDKLSIGKDGSAVGNAERATTEAATTSAEDPGDKDEKALNESEGQKEAEVASHDTNEQAKETVVAEEQSSSDKHEPTIKASAPEPATTAESKKDEEKKDSEDPAPTVSNPVAETESVPVEELVQALPAQAEEPASPQPAASGNDSVSPPTPPHKDAPRPPEKPQLAPSALPSTPLSQKATKADREALADPESVAAIAQAFGRDSPALRSSMDTPKRVLTPLEIPRPADHSSAHDEKAALSAADNAEASSKAVAQEASEAPAAASTSDPEKSKAAEQDKDTPRGGIRIGKGPPPATQASEELPFDFNRFLEQMKHRSAQPVGEYVRSFIKGFAKKPYRTQDQIKLIFDFLDFIAERMRECDVWKNLSDSDFENAKEAMEKLVMNRLYPYTFTPAVQKEGRFAVQTDDLERDRVLQQRIALFGWLSEEHLDVPVGDHSRGFIEFSIQELLKINHYKAPRDKLICILNACKVIFGMIRHLSTQENADTFIPVLIFVVLKANPEHLISNVEYISRFRNPDRLSSESGYYLSSLMGAIAFIETMDYTSLSNITQEEFEKRVEAAVSSLPEPEASSHAGASMLAPPSTPPPRGASLSQGQPGYAERQRSVSATSVSAPSGPGEEAAKALPFTPMAASLADDTRAFFLRTGEAARTGLSRPMGALGRLINEGIEGIRTPSSSNNDSGASTERQNSPAPPPGPTGLTASTSRSKLFGGLFGSLDTSNTSYPGQQAGRRSLMVDDEPQTPSTGDLMQDGFQPYNVGGPGGAPNASNRILRPNMPQRNYSIDDTMFDDESAGRRNLMATSAGSGHGHYDYDDEDYHFDDRHSADAAAQQRRRMQMQQDFGFPGTPSRRPTQEPQQGRLQPGRRDDIAVENAQTDEAIHRSLLDQHRLNADEAAQNSASVETLKSIFPTMDDGVIGMVLQGCEGNVETAIDRLLEMQ